ncbi:bacterial alpha-L-rhamnosidase-domain-containing protein [Aspergillus parasiticus]|uniref:alpha-L-rhamnosidase n=1 Tax=Aspergillus parasiticus TaxID=5067 RepID=A0A5N6DL01_ASPPA|nr:bacterial alpha-L-rhamnosidase-domain-containing protein [Aspergillus parasiticus]
MWLWYTPALLTGTVLMLLPAWSCAAVQVTHLSVDGRTDSPLDLGNPRPSLTWQINQIHDSDESVCPGDRQTAYEIQAAKTIADLSEGQLLWDSGKVNSSKQQVRFGHELKSRDSIAWHVRVWDAYGDASNWSSPATWTPGLLEQSDWGEARWIDYPGRTENQPLPLFALTDAWCSGSDYNATREQVDWDRPGADLESKHWIAAGFAPPPNLATRLVARAAEPVKIQERLTPVSVVEPAPGTWVFDFGQNIVGFPLLNLPELPAGTTVKVAPAESLAANGTVDQASLGPGDRATDLFNTYTTAGRPGGETWHPKFNYFGMQWVQVTGLPRGYKPSRDLITGLRVQADVPAASSFTSSSARLNRIHKMAWHSMASNIMSVFTYCPGREKQSYPADYTQPFGALARNFQFPAFLRTTIHHLVEGQSIANTSMVGNVALKTPVYDWGYSGRFGDEINWGNAIVLVPSLLYDLYGDTTVMATYYDQLIGFVDYIQREKARGHIVDAALADWVEDSSQTSGSITGTWGYYLTIKGMARIANLTGHQADAHRYANLSHDIRNAFNSAFWNDSSRRYTNTGNNGTSNATQTAQALALDSGLVPEKHRQEVLNALVELTYDYPSSDRVGPRLSGGQIGLGPIVRALSAGGRDDVLWEALQQNDRPSYGYFMAPTVANPDGFTTIGERWDRSDSKNHMILAQIDEWFHAGVVGIQPVALTTLSSTWENRLIFQPKLVGDLTSASGTYQMLQGEARCEWQRTVEGNFHLTVTVPANVEAEVRLPSVGKVNASRRARFVRVDSDYTIYAVPAGTHMFNNETTHAVDG